MAESFVDLTYRGLSLGRRVKLAQVRPESGYLEMPAPMPVGTAIGIVTDEGHAIDATVKAIHEQVGGSDKVPGMVVTPALGKPEIAAWWSARVSLADEPVVAAPAPAPITAAAPTEPPKAPVTKPGIAVPAPIEDTSPAITEPDLPITAHAGERHDTTEMPPLDAKAAARAMALEQARGLAAAAEAADGRTIVMPAVQAPDEEATVTESKPTKRKTKAQRAVAEPAMSDADVMAAASALATNAPTPVPVRVSEQHSIPEIVDDGKKTVTMDAVDPALLEQLLAQSSDASEHGDGRTTVMAAMDLSKLGLTDPGTSGEMAVVEGEISGEVTSETSNEDSSPIDVDGDKKPKTGAKRRRPAKRR